MYSAVCFLFLPTGSTYEDEQKKQETNVIELQTVIDESEQQTFNIKCFLRLVKGYMELDRLTSEFLRMFVEKIVIHEPIKEDSRRIQQVDTFYNFVGQLDMSIKKATTKKRTSQEILMDALDIVYTILSPCVDNI